MMATIRQQRSSTVKAQCAKKAETRCAFDRYPGWTWKEGEIMTKTMMALATAATLAVTAMAAPAPAEAGGGRWVGPAIGGLAIGAIAGAAIASSRPAYAYPPGYYAPTAYGPGCYWTRERFWDGWGWRFRRVQVCG
jgi:hypothetical protein